MSDRVTYIGHGTVLLELGGVRLVTDREGNLKGLIGMTVRQVEGAVRFEDKTCPFRVSGNETLIFQDGAFRSAGGPGVVMPTYG